MADLASAMPGSDEEQGLYFIRSASIVGNCALWWCEGGEGYTCNLLGAGRFTRREVDRILRNRAGDVAYPCSDVIFGTEAEADHRSARVAVTRWCASVGIGKGGEWNAEMVADAICTDAAALIDHLKVIVEGMGHA